MTPASLTSRHRDAAPDRVSPLDGRRRLLRVVRRVSGAADAVVPSAGRKGGDHVVLNEEVFNSVLRREEMCAERYVRPLCVVLVSDDRPRFGRSSSIGEASDILKSSMRRSDVMGWLRVNDVLGIALPGVNDADAERLRERFQRVLSDRYGAGTSVRVSVRARQVGAGDCAPLQSNVDTPRPKYRRGRRLYAFLKRACDLAGSATALIVLSPLLLLIAVLVKLSSQGPFLFRQERIGHRGVPFTMLKFRTMITGADPLLHQRFVSRFIKARETAGAASEDAPFKIHDDPRVTRIGRVLRKTSCDELPQLWNVLRGDMSLVGPRPALDYEVAQYEPWQQRRIMDVKPGLTGLWQVNGRSRTTFEQMVRLDLHYAKTCSFWGDIKILLATPKAVVSGKGAR